MSEEKEKVEAIVEKTEMFKDEKKKIDPKIIEELQKKIEEKANELENKKYLIPGGVDIAKIIKSFVVKEAKWKFTECLGVVEINRSMHEFINDPAKKELMVNPLTLEALYYFMARHDGVGLPEAEKFVSLLKAINQAKHRADEDKKEFEEMQFRLQSLQHGIDPDKPMETFEEDKQPISETPVE